MPEWLLDLNNSLSSGEGVMGTVMSIAYSIAVIIFFVILISFIYHWNYYGVSKGRKLLMLSVFSFVGVVILLVTGIVMMRFL